MGMPEPALIIESPDEVATYLSGIGIQDPDVLALVADEAFTARHSATENHPLGTAGDFAYRDGVRRLRDELLTHQDWSRVDVGGVAYAENETTRSRVGYWNVDQACRTSTPPIKNSNLGPWTMNALRSNSSQGTLDLDDPNNGVESVGWTYWFLMVGRDGTAELSLVNEMQQFHVRLFIVTSADVDSLDDIDRLDESDDELDDDIDVPVRKKV